MLDGGVASASGASVDAHAVALRTITAQQEVIARLQELVHTLKQRVDAAEAHAHTHSTVDAEQQQQDEHVRTLHERVQQLTDEKAQLASALSRASDVVKEQQSRLVEQAAQLHAHAATARQWHEQRAMYEMAKVQHAQQHATLTALQRRLTCARRARAQWRTLARLLAARVVGPALQSEVQARMRELDSYDDDEDDEAMAESAMLTAPIADAYDTPALSRRRMRVAASSRALSSRNDDDDATTAAPAAEDVLAVWKTSEHGSERGTTAALQSSRVQPRQRWHGAVHTSAPSSSSHHRAAKSLQQQPRSRRALPRFLVPL